MYISLLAIRRDDRGSTFSVQSIDYSPKNSNGNIWTKYLKKMCYILWGIITITGALTGNTSFSFIDEDAAIIGTFAGGMIGFIAGFASIAIVMAFITLCENISVMNKNTEEILNLLKDKK